MTDPDYDDTQVDRRPRIIWNGFGRGRAPETMFAHEDPAIRVLRQHIIQLEAMRSDLNQMLRQSAAIIEASKGGPKNGA